LPATTFIFVRHGATAANVCQPYLVQGRLPDTDLVEEGRRQAIEAGRALAEFAIDHGYCSPLKRAVQTAGLLADHTDVSVAVEPGLIEIDTGVWSALSWLEIEKRWPEEHRLFQDDAERHGYLGGENLGQLRDRLLPVIDRLADRHAGATILIVGHGVANRVLLAHWTGIPLRYARRLPQENGGISIVEKHDANYKVRVINATYGLIWSPGT